MSLTGNRALEEAKKYDLEVIRHVDETGGKGCGDMDCQLCGTYADRMREEEEAYRASEMHESGYHPSEALEINISDCDLPF